MKNIYTRIATKTRGGAQFDTIPYVASKPNVDEYGVPIKEVPSSSPQQQYVEPKTESYSSSPIQEEYAEPVQTVIPYSTEESHTVFYIVFAIGNLIALAFIAIGIVLMVKKTDTANATITAVDCSKSPCVVAFKFIASNGKNITGYTSLKGTFKVNDILTIQYNKENPNSFTVSKLNTKSFGGIWLGIGAFLLLILWIVFLIKRRRT